MNKLTTILASTLLATTFGVASAAGNIGNIDLKDVKIFTEMKEAIKLGKSLFENHCLRNLEDNGFNDGYKITTTHLENIASVECDISSGANLFVMGDSATDVELCDQDLAGSGAGTGRCPVIRITMATLAGSHYTGAVLAVVPLFGDDKMVHVAATGDVFEESSLLLTDYCMASDATADTELYVNLVTVETTTDLELPEVLGEKVCVQASHNVG